MAEFMIAEGGVEESAPGTKPFYVVRVWQPSTNVHHERVVDPFVVANRIGFDAWALLGKMAQTIRDYLRA